MQSTTDPAPARPRPSLTDYYRVNRGGGLFTEATGQWVATVIASTAYRLGVPPDGLTLINLVIGLGTSITVICLAGPVAAGSVPAWPIGLLRWWAGRSRTSSTARTGSWRGPPARPARPAPGWTFSATSPARAPW